MSQTRLARALGSAAAALLLALPAASDPARIPALDPLFLRAAELPPGWEIVTERGEDAREDPDLVRAGVRERLGRHYTRARGARSEVCSVELWSFANAERAGRAERMLPQDAARVQQIGPLLISLRAATLVRRRGLTPGLFPDCVALGDRIQARARRALGGGRP